MLFMQTVKTDIELCLYLSPTKALKGQKYYVLKSDNIRSYAYSDNAHIKYIELKDDNNNFTGEFRYLKTISLSQLKMMLVLKPDLRIEDLLDVISSNGNS